MGRTNFNWGLDMKEVDCYLVPKEVVTQDYLYRERLRSYIKVLKYQIKHVTYSKFPEFTNCES